MVEGELKVEVTREVEVELGGGRRGERGGERRDGDGKGWWKER